MITPDSIALAVAVVAERRPASSPWAEHVWRVVEVLENFTAVPDWTVLREAEGATRFFAGEAAVWLHPTDTDNYRHNLAAAVPRVWVLLRPVEAAPGMQLRTVTVDAGEAQLYAESGNDLLESLPMPPRLRATVEAFVAQHHRERGFWKRQRDRVDGEAMAQRPGGPRGPRAEAEE